MSNEATPDVTLNDQRNIINSDLTVWKNTRFQLQMRYRVQKSLEKLGDVSEPLKAIETELTRCEAAIETLNQMLAEINSVTPDTPASAPTTR